MNLLTTLGLVLHTNIYFSYCQMTDEVLKQMQLLLIYLILNQELVIWICFRHFNQFVNFVDLPEVFLLSHHFSFFLHGIMNPPVLFPKISIG